MKLKKGLRLLGIWVLVFSLTACGSGEDLAQVSKQKEQIESEETSTASPKNTEVPDKEKETVEKESSATEVSQEDTVAEKQEDTQTAETKLKYDLTKEDIAKFDAQQEICLNMIQEARSYEEVDAEIEKIYDIALEIQDKTTIAEILYYCHMNDAKATKDYLDGTELISELILEYNDLLLEMYNGDNEEYQKFFEDWSEIELKLLTCPSEESMDLELRNAEILTELYSMDETEAEEKVGELYSEFIMNSNLIGAEYGYTNYYDYASEAVYMRDYGKEEREQFREYVKQYIVPVYNVVALQYEQSLYDLSLGEADCLMEILFTDTEELSTDYLSDYFATLSPDMEEGMEHMFENNNYIMTDAEDAYVGAFTANIGEPFCFFGPESQTVFVIIHELGHYYADLCMEEELMSYDLAETQSQGNEMLFLGHLKSKLSDEVYKALVYYQLYNFTNVIIQSTIFDEFEEFVYGLEDVSGYTTEDYDRIMYDIVLSYAIDDPYDIIPEGMLWLWKNVGIESPVYYLSYAVSATAAMNLYGQSVADYDAAVEAYRKLQEEVTYETGFKKALEHAGIPSVFEAQSYRSLFDVLPNES